MTLTQFLSWLFGRIAKVLDWFGIDYYALANGARNAWNWAVTLSRNAYNDAVDWAWQKIEIARLLMNTAIFIAKFELQLIIYQVKNEVINLLNSAIAGVFGAIEVAKAIALALYNTAIAVARELTAKVDAKLTSYIQTLISMVTDLFSPLLVLKDSVSNILAISKGNVFVNLIMLATILYNTLTMFIGNPVGFILGVIQPKFITFFCYVTAYALGTTKYVLPVMPSWGIGGSPGGVPNPTGIPPGQGVITHPVEPVYVSGYTFNEGHKGIDLGIKRGQEVYASHAGVVTASRLSTSGYGLMIDITGVSIWTKYAHLMQLLVSENDRVNEGQLIAYGDSTGNSTGDHLHFELKVNGIYVDPIGYL